MKAIIKTTCKILFRNPGFWFFLLITPVLSTVVLRLQQTNLGAYEVTSVYEKMELKSESDKVAYYGGKGKYVIKVYDASGSDLSEYLLDKLSASGAFLVCRVKTPEMTKTDADARMKIDGSDDRMGAAMYLGKSFDEEAVSGTLQDGMVVYTLSEDERKALLDNELHMIIGQIKTAAAAVGSDNAAAYLAEVNSKLPEMKVVSLAGTNARNLTNEQLDQKALMGYAFAILTLGFVFGGIFVAHTVISEQKDMVLTRIRLTNITPKAYYAAKFLCGGIVSLLLTVVMGGCSFMIDTGRLGINRVSLLAMVFLLGVIFCSMSLLFGILLGNIFSANVAAFSLWSMSSLLSGLYFPLDSSAKTVKTISYMMPQKWFMDATEMLMVRDNKVYFVLICVTIAYMVITLSLGSVGIRFRNSDE
ncbi:MAG: ABC transporter permease [Lachnospiraceae bacterium]|nr:ABC transporter permease [Lachnospiraceae bacterium]